MIRPSLVPQFLAAVLLAVAFCAATAATAAAANLPPGFREDRFLTDLVAPTSVAFAPDGRIFVSEKSGLIVVYSDLQDDEKTIVANLRKQVYDADDRGLLAMAIDPDFGSGRPYLYALYTYDHVIGVDPPGVYPHWGEAPFYVGDPCPVPPDSTADACAVSGRLVRLTVTEGGAGDGVIEFGGEAVEHPLIAEDWCQQFRSHSIGDLEFDPAGNLYASGGDGASFIQPDYGEFGFPGQENVCADPPGGIGDLLRPPDAEGGALRSQDLRTSGDLIGDPTGLGGSVIRIDPDTGAGVPGNPFFGQLDANAERIVAYGYRNPFRFSLDPAHGDLYVSNVGWSSFEELDRVPMVPDGEPTNSGWPCYEGPGPNPSYEDLGLDICADLYDEGDATVAPFLTYKHKTPLVPEDGCALQLGSAAGATQIYPGGDFPDSYDGALFFADMVRRCIWVMKAGEDGRPDPHTVAPFLTEGGLYPGADMVIGPGGEFFYLKYWGEQDAGSLRRISYDPDSPRARLTADRVYGEESPLAVNLDASGSFDPNEEGLEYDWDLNGDGSFEVTGTDEPSRQALVHEGAEIESPEDRNVVVRVRAKDETGKTDVAELTLYPGDTPPDPAIDAPAENWTVGDRLDFSGSASDAEDGDLGVEGLFWRTELYHCPEECHAHPLREFPGTDEGSFFAPDHDYPSHVNLILTATDSRGLSATEEVALNPATTELRIESYPPGVSISAGVGDGVAPYSLMALKGGKITLTAPQTAIIDGVEEKFLRWSNGGPRVQTVTAGFALPYRAFYREEPIIGDPGPPSPPPSPPSPPPPLDPQSQLRVKPSKRTASTSARFVFGAKPTGSRLQCKLDGKPWVGCRSPKVYRGLGRGWHTLRVRAIGPDGSVEKTPSVYRWRAEPKPRKR